MQLKLTLAVASLIVVSGGQLWAQDVAPSGGDKAAQVRELQAEPPAKPTPPAADPQQVKDAEALLKAVSDAYRAAPAMTDSVKIEAKSPFGPNTDELEVILGKGSDGQAKTNGLSMTAVDNQLFIVIDEIKDKYLKTPLKNNLGATVQDLFGGGAPIPPHFALRAEGNSSEALVTALAMGMLEKPRIVGHGKGTSPAGEDVNEIRLWGEGGGTANVQVQPATNMISHIVLDFVPQGAPEDFRVNAVVSMSPQKAESLKEPIAFEPGDRTAVASLEELFPQEEPESNTIKAGTDAPDFTLKTPAGDDVTLSALKGNVVVLDFWATWCGPCKRALPFLQEFTTWAESSGKPIKVYAVDVWERAADAATRTKLGIDYWEAQGYTIPLLSDSENTVAEKFGFNSIPTTIVVGPDGKVAAVHTGFSRDMVDRLKKDVEAALASK